MNKSRANLTVMYMRLSQLKNWCEIKYQKKVENKYYEFYFFYFSKNSWYPVFYSIDFLWSIKLLENLFNKEMEIKN